MRSRQGEKALNILMLAAENGALPGGKVGGIGDVIRDAPGALAALEHSVTVLTPGYGHFSRLPGATRIDTLQTVFRGQRERVSLHRVPSRTGTAGVSCLALEHPLFSSAGPARIYVDDDPGRPFATDGSRFALFCAAAAAAITDGVIPRPDIIHLHDWHSALFALLLHTDPVYAAIADIPLVYTIHNLALQGIRPLSGDESALFSWFPSLPHLPPSAIDPRYRDCYNPMRAAIALCGRVHAVSPQYAEEICDPDSDFGCGLQADLRNARHEGRLVGILNGCDYPDVAPPPATFADTLALARRDVRRWIGRTAEAHSSHVLALHQLDLWLAGRQPRPQALLTSVGRLTDQKLGLLCSVMPDGRLCLEHALDALGDDGLCVMLGSGDPTLEMTLTRLASERDNLLFLCGYSDALADALYAAGDLFLMPSTFEPCGISQMLAMREGQPCLVNAVGGLVDTVQDGETGFVFAADADVGAEQALLMRLGEALDCLRGQPDAYRRIRAGAAAERFPWGRAALAYGEMLYRPLLPASPESQ
ncbi:glycogen synthase [Chromatocurvus halotolerans]|uniref:starch synthase n=1 Tax=Chromatocurvus halotolerans TaxID=1132028 RepID=A0A4R2KP14_9GAMM|nr:glycogen/starch synthase [Chromatocurvus halotolerans]TCO75453.1 starch synthase [Chromatocurvus halotolerans]